MANQLTHKQFFNAPAVQQKFQEVLDGKEKQFTASLLSIIGNNKLLANASNDSIMTAAMKAAVLNLPIEPSLGYAYIVPYKRDAQFQLGYKGLIQLAQRSGQIQKLSAGEVYENQFKSYNPLTEDLEIDPFAMPKKGEKVVGYFAFMRLVNGFEKTVFWSRERVEEHGKKYSQSFGNKFSPWQTDFDAMARKTVLKQMLSTYAPLSVEMQDALVADNESEAANRQPVDVTPTNQENQDLLGDLLAEEPVADQETGEIIEEITLLDGDTTQIKEVE